MIKQFIYCQTNIRRENRLLSKQFIRSKVMKQYKNEVLIRVAHLI